MRIGSGVQSAPEVFGKRQNNSKTSAVGNEEFSQTSVKVYLKTDDMLFSGGNGTDRKKSESCRQADCTDKRRNIKFNYFNIRWLWCSNSESGC